MYKIWSIVLFAMLFLVNRVDAQTCPENIDYSEGDFNKWVCSIGFVDAAGVVSVTPGNPVSGRQTLVPNTSTAVDYYGNFSVVAPNGNANTLILGNAIGGHQAEQVSYTYTIPANKQDFIFTYYYAVVLQLTNHLNFERPRFAVSLTDLTTKEIVPCGTHDFVSGDGLGDFKKSTKGDVEYRDWSTVAVNLAGRGGHTIQFDFTTNDCVYNAHFGYAYVSFSDPCDLSNQSITGNTICNGAASITLTAPPGFDQYIWHLPGSDVSLSGERQYVPPTLPADGTKYIVDAESFTGVGQGCPASFATTVHIVDQSFVFNLKPSVTACAINGVNLKNASLTAGSSSDLKYKYFVDATQKIAVRDPTFVTQSGTYYILGTNTYGCSDVKSIEVNIIPDPTVTITPPKAVCKPATVDLTDPGIVGGFTSGLTYQYYYDVLATKPIPNPGAVTDIGSYYVKITNNIGCTNVFPIKVTVYDIPYIKPNALVGCAPFNITLPIYHGDDTNNLTYKYFIDAAGTVPLEHPEAITIEGTYYAMGINEIGCTTPALVPITISLKPAAVFSPMDPTPVKYPATVDLQTTFSASTGYSYNYYADAAATIPLSNYQAISVSGVYYVKATSTNGCELIKPVKVTITEPDPAGILVKNTFTPNGDGINDEFVPVLQGVASVNYLKIYARNGSLVFETKDITTYWKGTISGVQLPQGTYYWVFKGYDNYRKKAVTQSGSVTIVR